MSQTRVLPDCWGHRGASARFPENTLASFEAAIGDGAEGIESDVHVTADGVIVMFHDPSLERTTDATGQIKEWNWHGEHGMQNVRTLKEPKQAIATFAETIALLMKPENHHVHFNIDVKAQNDPDRLFQLMHHIVSAQLSWETILAPRLLLGLWHPRFIAPAATHMPYCRRSYIGKSPAIARQYFWHHCDVFSVAFSALTSADGHMFREECEAAGKTVVVWTVNDPDFMMEAVRWGVRAIITDVTTTWLDIRAALQLDYEGIIAQYGRVFLSINPTLQLPSIIAASVQERLTLESIAGPFDVALISSCPAVEAATCGSW